MYSQKWNCSASFPISKFMYLWAIYIFPGSVYLFCFCKIGRRILRIYEPLTDTQMWKWVTEHYNYVLEINRSPSFFSGNTKIGTRHLNWILTGPFWSAHRTICIGSRWALWLSTSLVPPSFDSVSVNITPSRLSIGWTTLRVDSL